MSLDTSRLEKYRKQGSDHIARCPACALTGGDTAGDHLFLNDKGEFGCVLFQGDAGKEHRAEILNLAGIKSDTKEKSIWKALPSAPQSSPAPSLNHFKLGTPAAHWIYRTNEGRVAGITARFNTAAGKATRPMTWCKDQHENTGWQWKAQAEPRTIYGLPINDRSVVVVEGEKTAEAIKDAGLSVTTWQGGASTVTKSDWSPLAGKKCFIWADNDAPGLKAKGELIAALASIAAEIRIVQIPDGMPEGWDAADTTPAEILRLVDEAVVLDPEDYPQPDPGEKQDAKTAPTAGQRLAFEYFHNRLAKSPRANAVAYS